jgi:hypothetical protein
VAPLLNAVGLDEKKRCHGDGHYCGECKHSTHDSSTHSDLPRVRAEPAR